MPEQTKFGTPKAISFTRNGQFTSVYVEGLSQLMLGFPTSRVVMHNMVSRSSDDPDAAEVQNQTLEFVIPTPALIEMCKNILTHLAAVAPQIKEGGEQWTQNSARLLDSISLDPNE